MDCAACCGLTDPGDETFARNGLLCLLRLADYQPRAADPAFPGQGRRRTAAGCDASLAQARAFFPRYFPEWDFRYFSCCPRLLDEGALPLAGPMSNIAAFQRRFQILSKAPSDAVLRFVFRWDLRREDLPGVTAQNRFQRAVQETVLSGGQFYEATGVIPR